MSSSMSQYAYPNIQRPSGSSMSPHSRRRSASPYKIGAQPNGQGPDQDINENAIPLHSGNSQIISEPNAAMTISSISVGRFHD
jgi:hypothetical protein